MSPLSLYRAVTLAAGPFTAAYLERRRRSGKEDPARLGERRGFASRPRPPGKLLWIHAASVGETASVLALVDRVLAERAVSVLVTTGTLTSARLLAGRETPRRRPIHQFVPLDHPRYVGRFLDHWRPDLAIWVESELWPNLIRAAGERRVPMLLVNARMSQRSFRRWHRVPGMIRPLLQSFDLCLAQDPTQAARLRQLGARRALSVGDLKAAAAPLPAAAAALDHLAERIGNRPVWLAASTHAGEEAIVAAAHRALSREVPAILTLLAPRHPARGESIAAMLRAKGLAVARRGAGEEIAAATDIYLADTLGELGLFYRLCGIAFVGGSLVPRGGHNPYEAARLGCAILHGPDMSNAAGPAQALADADAALVVRDAAAMAGAVRRLILSPGERARRAAAAMAVAEASRGALDAVVAAITPWLERLSPAHADPVPA